MNERINQELELLRARFPGLEYQEEGRWVLLPKYGAPRGVWSTDCPDICFQIQPAHPGQKPYAFYVRMPFSLQSGAEVLNATPSREPPFGGEWLKFSWDAPDWNATAEIRSGSNLLNWALTFRGRLEEGA